MAIIVIALPFSYVAREIERDVREAGDCESLDHPEPCTEHVPVLIGAAAAGLGLWGAAAGVGLLTGRRWARRSAQIVFSLWTGLATASWLGTALADGGLDAAGTITFAVTVGVCITVVALAAHSRVP